MRTTRQPPIDLDLARAIDFDLSRPEDLELSRVILRARDLARAVDLGSGLDLRHVDDLRYTLTRARALALGFVRARSLELDKDFDCGMDLIRAIDRARVRARKLSRGVQPATPDPKTARTAWRLRLLAVRFLPRIEQAM